MAVSAHALNAAHRFKMLCIAKVDKRVQARHSFKNDIATFAAIAAIRAAILDIFLAPKADSPRATCARTDKNLSLVKKMHNWPLGENAGFG